MTVSTLARPRRPGSSHLGGLHLSPGLRPVRSPAGTDPRAPHRSSFVHTERTLRQLPRAGPSFPHRQTGRAKPSKLPPPSPPPCGPEGHRVPVPASLAPATNQRRHRLQVANRRAARSKPAPPLAPPAALQVLGDSFQCYPRRLRWEDGRHQAGKDHIL